MSYDIDTLFLYFNMKSSPLSNLSSLLIGDVASASPHGESSSISSVLSHGGGGGSDPRGGDTVPGSGVNQEGMNVLFIRNVDSLCCGIIGASGGSKLCNKPRISCGIVSHSKSRCPPVWTEPVFCYYTGPTAKSYFLPEPALPVESMNPGQGSALMQKIFTPQSWFEEAAIFKVAAGEDIHPEVLKTAIKVKQSKDLKDINLSPLALDFGEMHISKTDTLKAESSLNLSSLLDAKREDIANEEGLGLSGKPDDMLEFNSFIGTMASQVDKIKDLAFSAVEGLASFQTSTGPSLRLLFTQSKVHQVELEMLKAKVENLPAEEEQQPSELAELTSAFNATGLKNLAGRGEKVLGYSELVRILPNDLLGSDSPIRKVLLDFNSHLTSTIRKVDELKRDADASWNQAGAGSARGGDPWFGLRVGRDDGVNQVPAAEVAKVEKVQMDAVNLAVEDLKSEIEKLQRQVAGTNNVGDMAVTFRNETFHSQEDFSGFVE